MARNGAGLGSLPALAIVPLAGRRRGTIFGVVSLGLAAARASLYKEEGLTARVSMTHKCEPRKLTYSLPEGQLVLHRDPEYAGELEEFLRKFGLPYYGCGLPQAVGQVMELLLRPKRAAFSQKKRLEQYNSQNGRCAICDGELRTGEDEGDHLQPLRDAIRGEEQQFRLLCVSCHQNVSDPGQRREAEILRSHFNLHTWGFCEAPKPVPATWVCEKFDSRRDLVHVDLKKMQEVALV